jgi:hypothetical protein
MAVCVNCGGFALIGPLCALCANTVPEDQWSTVQGRLRNQGSQTSTQSQSTTITYTLGGELASRSWDSTEVTFFDTVLHGGDGNAESIWNGRTAFHRTRPRQNFVVVYQRRTDSGINIIGIGSHQGNSNKKYSILFDTGATVTCTRA